MRDILKHFLADTQNHRLEIRHDDGLYRHLVCHDGSPFSRFEVVTAPGYLFYAGDMGSYTFERLHDMFKFFRASDESRLYHLDFHYWAEKALAVCRHDGLKQFSPRRFRRAVQEELVEWMRDHWDETTAEERQELWREARDWVIHADDNDSGQMRMNAAHNFEHTVGNAGVFRLNHVVEEPHLLEEYTDRFVWACYALRWAIAQYDRQKQGPQRPVENSQPAAAAA